MTFQEMLQEVCGRHQLAAVAAGIGCSPQYVCDMKLGRRLPSVRITKAICDWMGRGPKGRLEWHLAAARAHGWEV